MVPLVCDASAFALLLCFPRADAEVLKAGGAADVPMYDFTVHSRKEETTRYVLVFSRQHTGQ